MLELTQLALWVCQMVSPLSKWTVRLNSRTMYPHPGVGRRGSRILWRLNGVCRKEAAQENWQTQAPQDAEEDPLAAAARLGTSRARADGGHADAPVK